jgi:peroxiredoxin Q/BCP
MLKVGDFAPEFALASDKGEVTSSDLLGKRYVLYFYPRDDTSGCTVEACSFRDNLPKFESINVPVYGVSADDLKAHAKFSAKHGLNFTLLSDPDHKVIEAFGAWVEKNMYGRKYMGIQRSTFVIARNGQVEQVWEKVKPEGHAEEVYKWLNSSQAEDREDEMEYRTEAPKPKAKKSPARTK